jgi:hypothetical protein
MRWASEVKSKCDCQAVGTVELETQKEAEQLASDVIDCWLKSKCRAVLCLLCNCHKSAKSNRKKPF